MNDGALSEGDPVYSHLIQDIHTSYQKDLVPRLMSDEASLSLVIYLQTGVFFSYLMIKRCRIAAQRLLHSLSSTPK
jgi:hypothetical protein